jgi:hypothetical protein
LNSLQARLDATQQKLEEALVAKQMEVQKNLTLMLKFGVTEQANGEFSENNEKTKTKEA